MANSVVMNNYTDNSSCASYAVSMPSSYADLFRCGVVRLALAISALSIFAGLIVRHGSIIRLIGNSSGFRICA